MESAQTELLQPDIMIWTKDLVVEEWTDPCSDTVLSCFPQTPRACSHVQLDIGYMLSVFIQAEKLLSRGGLGQ